MEMPPNATPVTHCNKAVVLGDGAWATTLALLLAQKGSHVGLWCHFPEIVEQIDSRGVNETFLPEIELPGTIVPTTDIESAMAGAWLVVVAKPVVHLRTALDEVAPFLRAEQTLLSVSKGIEKDTLLRAGQIVEQVAGREDVALLLGPSHAEEVARRLPASVVAAARDEALARRIQDVFTTDRFRVYTTDDVVGVEVAAATKNVIAVAAGVCDGLGFGDNSKAALVTRGLAEIRRLGVAMGAHAETFSGLAGIGDLITTCVSPYGRNRRIGYEIGKGKTRDEALEAMAPAVPEGVWTARSTVELARREGVEMPITEEVYRLLFEDKPPLAAVNDLMHRTPKSEVEALE